MDVNRRRSPKLSRRLRPYWQMERACAFVFPPLAFAWVRPTSLIPAFVLALALIACCSTMLVGAAYWRAVWRRLDGDRSSMQHALPMAARWKALCCWTTIISAVVSVWAILTLGPIVATITALGFSILAVLEYINYYHIQIQNFDHGPTFRRFLKRRIFPRSHLAKDLAIFRKKQEQTVAHNERS